MIASGSRSSGLDIPFLEMDPIRHEIPNAPDSSPDLGTLAAGAVIAERYRVLHKIGEGGMGVLYACEDTVLVREVAVKLMQRSLAAEPQLAERLLREAQLAAQLKKHVAQVFDCGMLPSGEPYIVMELLHGRDLYSVLKESGPLPPARVASYMLEVCVGLAEAHEKGIVHRDLKPENLFCADEPDGTTVLKIVDFGVSKQLTSQRLRSYTNPTESVGSPQYMSPEQIMTPAEVDPRTDIWSLGVVMFELLTGSAPFKGSGAAQIVAAVLTKPIAPLSDYRDDVPPALQRIVLRCLQRDRAERFSTIAELQSALSAFVAGEDWSASLPGLPPKRRRRRWLGALCSVAVVGACVAVLGLAVRRGQIRLPSESDVLRLPSAISAWKLPFLSPTPGPEPAPVQQLGPPASPNVALEQRPLGPAVPATPSMPLTSVQARTPGAGAGTGAHQPIPESAPMTRPTPVTHRALVLHLPAKQLPDSPGQHLPVQNPELPVFAPPASTAAPEPDSPSLNDDSPYR